MRTIWVAISIAVLMVLSLAFASGSAVADGSHSNDSSDTNFTSSGISNFSVQINGQQIEVLSYFNYSLINPEMGSPIIREDSNTPLIWNGFGNVTIVPAVSFSAVGSLNFSSLELNYIYLYSSSYIGILLTTGFMNESGNQVSVSSSTMTVPFSIVLVNAPLSGYNFSQNSYRSVGNEYYGNFSSFNYANGQIENYSLVNGQSSVSVISEVYAQGGIRLSTSLNGFAIPGTPVGFASDGLFPLLFLSGAGSPVHLNLSDGFHFSSSDDHGDQGQGISDGEDAHLQNSFPIPLPRERILKIVSGLRVVGYADVYGAVSYNNTSLVASSPLSFLLVRFLPSFSTANTSNEGGKHLQNATTEILVSDQAYFIPFTVNVTSQQISFAQNILNFTFVQNGTQQFVIVIQGNFTVSSFSLVGSGANGSSYTVTRTGNQTIISFVANGSGQKSLSLAIAPLRASVSPIPLFVLFISSAALIVVTLSFIIYSRRKMMREIEKE